MERWKKSSANNQRNPSKPRFRLLLPGLSKAKEKEGKLFNVASSRSIQSENFGAGIFFFQTKNPEKNSFF